MRVVKNGGLACGTVVLCGGTVGTVNYPAGEAACIDVFRDVGNEMVSLLKQVRTCEYSGQDELLIQVKLYCDTFVTSFSSGNSSGSSESEGDELLMDRMDQWCMYMETILSQPADHTLCATKASVVCIPVLCSALVSDQDNDNRQDKDSTPDGAVLNLNTAYRQMENFIISCSFMATKVIHE